MKTFQIDKYLSKDNNKNITFEKQTFPEAFTAWKGSNNRVFTGPYFPEFGINIHIKFKDEKIQTRKKSVFRHFSHSDCSNVFTVDPNKVLSSKISLLSTMKFEKHLPKATVKTMERCP